MAACPISTVKVGDKPTFPLTVCDAVRLSYPTNSDFDMNRADEKVWVTVDGQEIIFHPTKLFYQLESNCGINPNDLTEVNSVMGRRMMVYVREFDPPNHYFITRSSDELLAMMTEYSDDQSIGSAKLMMIDDRPFLRLCNDKEVIYCVHCAIHGVRNHDG